MDAVVVRAEGVRIGLVTCDECGATIQVDHREDRDRVAEHLAWHAESVRKDELAAALVGAKLALVTIRDASEEVTGEELRAIAGQALTQRAA